jgi:HEAT repeat protein
MKNQVKSEIYKTTESLEDLPQNDIPSLIKQLSDPKGSNRRKARDTLICIGKPAVDALIDALSNASSQLRWQIIKALEGIQDPTTAPILVQQLKDDNPGVRWATANALIALRHDAIPPLLEALMHEYDSSWLRRGAHHILHVMKDAGILNEAEVKVFEALRGPEPTASVPWAAEKALESLR